MGFCWGDLEITRKSTICYRATIQTKYLYENINFCDHKNYIKVEGISFFKWVLNLTLSVEISNSKFAATEPLEAQRSD